MGILSFIERKWNWLGTHDVFEKLRRNRAPASPRSCQFGHAVFSGTDCAVTGTAPPEHGTTPQVGEER